MQLSSCLVLLGFCALSVPVYAARPMIADDAKIVDSKSCQLETWFKDTKQATEYWALPACNFTGNLEVTLGGARSINKDSPNETDFVLQGKTILRQFKTNEWGLGLVLGNIRHPSVGRLKHTLGDFYMNVPLTMAFNDDQFLLHANMGLLYEREVSQVQKTWGIGTETKINDSNWLVAEVFGQNDQNAYYQIGLRHWIIKEIVQIDSAYGNRLNGSEQWVTVGLRFLSAPFLP